MKSVATRLLFVATLLLPCSFVAHADEPPGGGDPRIDAQLKAGKLNYIVDENGNYVLQFTTTGERTQMVYVGAETDGYEEMELRTVYSPVMETDKPLPEALANKLLVSNGRLKFGAWITVGTPDELTLLFEVKIDANASLAMLMLVMGASAYIADDMELELVGKDKL